MEKVIRYAERNPVKAGLCKSPEDWHLVECEGLSRSRSYSIEEPVDSWEQWQAYAFSGAGLCGPLVALRPGARGNRIFNVPMSNPLLLGTEPGQVFRCSHRDVANWQGFAPF